MRQVARSVEHDELATGELRHPPPSRQRLAAVVAPVDHEHWLPCTRRHSVLRLVRTVRRAAFAFGDHRLDLGVECPRHCVLELLCRMRLRQLLVEEELDPRAITAARAPERAVPHAPSARVNEIVLPTVVRRGGVVVPRRNREGRCNQNETGDEVSMRVGQPHCPRRRVAMRNDDGFGNAGSSEHRDEVAVHFVGVVALSPMRSVRAVGTAPVGRDDRHVARQKRDQSLPGPCVADRRSRNEQDGRVPASVHLERDLDPVAIDEAFVVRSARSRSRDPVDEALDEVVDDDGLT